MPPRYKDVVGENPTADADIQVVTNYLNQLAAGNLDKAKMLLTDTYRGYGPAATDSATRDKVMAQWEQRYKTQLNRKVRFEGQTAFQVKTGRLRGNWVSTWGEYTFTDAGKTLKAPFQHIAHVTKGKIDVDRTYVDNLSLTLALGYKLTPPAATTAK
ncbi:nuclear transport factor 2 family protein [Hymenobacter lapidarius]|uniref:nuclear transport factor 2 family protein n=1 Tax=Hymenobacter lapidarius TaxID=1908237 RepID=UPI001300DB69|nr:nuclear transport factor 2 family protein [Hymenobacter lapidarius]